MSKKKKKREPKPSQRNTQAVDERVKQISSLQPPEENPWKMDNENKIDRFRPVGKGGRMSLAEKSRLEKRQNRAERARMNAPKKR